jgi:uncharacterized repeat protein (TIGR03803 family)
MKTMRNRFSYAGHYVALALVALGISLSAQAQTHKFSVLYAFKNNGADPANPDAPLIVDGGNLYGTSYSGGTLGLGTVFELTKSGTLSVLHSFQGGTSDGAYPQGLVRDAAGNFYGIAPSGGSAGMGVVFKITPSGVETVLYNFTNPNVVPLSTVQLDSSGNIYGIAAGGVNFSGLVFKIDTGNNYSVLYTFCSLANCADGEQPVSGLLKDATGNFYGTTTFGGASNLGTVFRLSPEGVETVLHSFSGNGDGSYPWVETLRQDASGNLYGVTSTGGVNDPTNLGPGGTLFKLPEAGGADTVLYSFCSLPNCADGYVPEGPVAIDKAGNFYGVTFLQNLSTTLVSKVWEVTKDGKEIVLHTFVENNSPGGGIVIDSTGTLYGPVSGGPANAGAIYKLTPGR